MLNKHTKRQQDGVIGIWKKHKGKITTLYSDNIWYKKFYSISYRLWLMFMWYSKAGYGPRPAGSIQNLGHDVVQATTPA